MVAVSDTRTSTIRLPASDRRRQLVETALDFFSRKGFGGTTTKEIAAAAGVTEAIIFRHFPTKSDLYNAVLDHHHNSGAALEGHEVALEHNRQISFPIFELLCQYVARRQSEGAIRQGNPGAIVAAVAGMATHYATMTQMFGFCANSDDRQIADSFVGIVMQGIQGNQPTQGAQ